MIIPIAQFAPDIADINSNASADIVNVLPANGSYIAMPSLNTYSNALPDKPLGSISIRVANGQTYLFVGTASKILLFNNQNNSWGDVSNAKPYNASESSPWCFAIFGNYLVAVNQNNAPQVFHLGKDTKFSDLKGNPPRAGVARVWGDFLCLMQLSDHPNRVHWSGLNDIEHWEAGKKNSDYQDFPEGEIVQGSTQSTNPIIFMRSAIYMGQFLPGSAVIFSFVKIHSKVGAKSSLGIATRGEIAFYIDEGGFFQIDNAGQITAIGNNIVDKTIFSRVTGANLSNCQAVVDIYHSRVYFAMDYSNIGYFDRIFVYDFSLQLWSQIEVEISNLVPVFLQGYSLDGLDTVSKNLDLLPFSLDSKVWQNKAPVMGAISKDKVLGFFSGQNMAAQLSSGELCDEQANCQEIAYARGIIDTQYYTIAIGTRARRDVTEAINWRNAVYPSHNSGRVIKRARGRYFTLRLDIEAGRNWLHIAGFETQFKFSGTR